MCYTNNEKWEMTNTGIKKKKKKNGRRKGNLQVIRNIRKEHHQTSVDEKKKTI